MTSLFVFGTLRHVPLLARVLDRDPDACGTRPAALPGHVAAAVADEDFPLLVAEEGARAEGLLIEGLTAREVARLDGYEGDFGFHLREVRVETPDGPAAAHAYFPEPGRWRTDGAWDFEGWVARWGEITALAAEEVMAAVEKGAEPAPPFARKARAWARIRGRAGAPQELRAPMTRDDIQDLRFLPGYDGFFRLRRFELSFRTFGGGVSERVQREGFAAFDAALVLPYDPVRDCVLLIEQFRYGPVLREDPTPWMLEPIAGLVDAGEEPADTARREAMEEAQLDLSGLEPMMQVYPSPGYTSEYFHCFLGIADLGGQHGTVAGLDAEHEDIRSHVVSFDRAMALIETGEINVGPLAMMLLWLARHRDRLRAAA
ncbi:ADP-ribose pyrophosphatase-like protein [Roseivivax marinus]|uniref:Putative gamma-glutamylcyclotransferase n=1 Tax=Roseivivax marinus TaxID=1379903 RepID=W4HI32_9RHOB|nr:NUDIX domain-containing protein [Roseivivax marinus]ETW11816.1 ADP-ribose pyrophosphatase-like protein [Roseivivax marinus]